MKDSDFKDGILKEEYIRSTIKGANNIINGPWVQGTERRNAEDMLQILRSHEKLRAKSAERRILDKNGVDGEVVLISFNYKAGTLKIERDLILRYFTELVDLVKTILRRGI